MKSEELEKKENLQNKTKAEIFETLAKELDEDLIKLKQQHEEKNGKLHFANETWVSKIDYKQADQSKYNNKEKIVIDKSISEKQNNDHIPQKNDEKKFFKTVMKMNKEIETLIKVEACHQKRKELISTIEKNEKTLEQKSISYL